MDTLVMNPNLHNKGWIHYSNDKSIFKSVEGLNFINLENVSLLWIKPNQCFFDAQEISLILDSFIPYTCLLWHVLCGNNFALQQINDYKRSFGNWKSIKKNTFVQKDVYIDGKKYYSDLSYLTKSECSEGKHFLSRSLFGLDSTLSFMPSISDIYSGFKHLEENWILRTQEISLFPSNKKRENINKYISEIVNQNGVAGLVVEDTECCKSLILIGHDEILVDSLEFLRMSKLFLLNSEISSFVSRGIGLKLLS